MPESITATPTPSPPGVWRGSPRVPRSVESARVVLRLDHGVDRDRLHVRKLCEVLECGCRYARRQRVDAVMRANDRMGPGLQRARQAGESVWDRADDDPLGVRDRRHERCARAVSSSLSTFRCDGCAWAASAESSSRRKKRDATRNAREIPGHSAHAGQQPSQRRPNARAGA